MNLKTQKKLASRILKCSSKKIRLDPERFEDIKESITKADIKSLIGDKSITRVQDKGVSRARAKKSKIQKRKGKQKGHGSRKGKQTARQPKKLTWINKIRLQRSFLKTIKEKGLITIQTYRNLYLKSKGGFFRNKRHLKLYIEEHNLFKKGSK